MFFYINNFILDWFDKLQFLLLGKDLDYQTLTGLLPSLIVNTLILGLCFILLRVFLIFLSKKKESKIILKNTVFIYNSKILKSKLQDIRHLLSSTDQKIDIFLASLFTELIEDKGAPVLTDNEENSQIKINHQEDSITEIYKEANYFITETNSLCTKFKEHLLQLNNIMYERKGPVVANFLIFISKIKSLFFKKYITFDDFKYVEPLTADNIDLKQMLNRIILVKENSRILLDKLKSTIIQLNSEFERANIKTAKKIFFSYFMFVLPFFMLFISVYLVIYSKHILRQLPAGNYPSQTFIEGVYSLLAALAVALFIAKLLSKNIKFFADHTLGELDRFLIIRRSLITGLYIIIFLVVLKFFGYDATPAIAALGIGGLAVALALKDTLENFFAGIQTVIGKKFSPGDYILISDANIEGTVDSINWSYTSIVNLRGDLLVVPNAKINQSLVTNIGAGSQQAHDMIDPASRNFLTIVDFSVAYESDLPQVERVAGQAVAEFAKQEFGEIDEDVDYEKSILVVNYGDSGIDYIAILKGQGYAKSRGRIRASFIKLLHKKFKDNNIEFPYPTRTLYLRKEQ